MKEPAIKRYLHNAAHLIVGLLIVPAAFQLTSASDHVGRRAILDRFGDRFAKEVYPLLSRGQNGCKACHFADSPRIFRVLNTPLATYSLLIEQDVLGLADPMHIVPRLRTADPELRMPKAGALTPGEIDGIASFAKDLQDALNQAGSDGTSKADERFPDRLLLPFDGKPRDSRVSRILTYYQFRQSAIAIFGEKWYAAAGHDPFQNKAHLFGGADFKSSFEISRTPSANYLTALQEVARELARRYVSAPKESLFTGFDPEVPAARSRAAAIRNVTSLYDRILLRAPTQKEIEGALRLVAGVQAQPVTERIVRLSLTVRDEDGLEDGAEMDLCLRQSRATVSRFLLDQTHAPSDSDPWVRVGSKPFKFDRVNAGHMVRMVSVPGNYTTAFDAVRLVRVENGVETKEEIVLDNTDAECATFGDWRAISKAGIKDRAGNAARKYSEPLHVVGINHLESRNLRNELRYVSMALRLARSGEYNVYLTWPAIPQRTPAAMVEIHSADAQTGAPPPIQAAAPSQGFATLFMDQTESTLNEEGDSQWQSIHKRVFLSGESDYVEIGSKGVDVSKYMVVADAVKFVSLDETSKEEIIVDNSSSEGFEKTATWKADKLQNRGGGEPYGANFLTYPPATNGRISNTAKIDPAHEEWARFRPIKDGKYRPGWYQVYMWSTGGAGHADQVPVEIHGTKFAPLVHLEQPPLMQVGETVQLNATATYHPLGKKLSYRWTHDARDIGLKLDEANTAMPRLTIPPLRSSRPGWAALIEALLQHPGYVMPAAGPDSQPREKLRRVALDLVGRVPSTEEIRRFERTRRLGPSVDEYLASPDFKDFFFHRVRAKLMSRGTPESDEPARLWTHLAMHDVSYRDLFTADYTVDPEWKKAARSKEHGRTGILTMKGYMAGKPGLPHFIYPADVLNLTMGVTFELSDVINNARKNVVSTTDPASICYGCHKLLTPLAMQRQRWNDNGVYAAKDKQGNPVDDGDHDIIPDYPFKGPGLESFATQVVKKEKFARTFINIHHDLLFHRQVRVFEEDRQKYKQLYDFAVANELKIRPLLKKLVLMEYGEGDNR